MTSIDDMSGFTSNRLSAGTQVVVAKAVHGVNGVVAHPRGAVGVITRTPVGIESAYTVRFPDGFESAIEPSDLDVLKHFKGRLDEAAGMGAFDLESCVIYRCIAGSRAYGLETEESDVDRRGIYLAPPNLQWSLFGAPEQFEDNAVQACYWEFQKFIVQALKANPNILECLYSPVVEKCTPLADELLGMREVFLSQMIFQTFNGYALSQFKKIEQDIRNQGAVRWKHAMHLLRLLITGAAALRERRIPERVEMHRDRLLSVRRGELPWAEVDTWRRELHADFERALSATGLPERPDYDAANALLIRARAQAAAALTLGAPSR